MELFAIAIFLATVNRSLVEYLSAPLKQRYPDRNFWWLLYAALLTGFLIGWFSEINLFSPYLPNLTAGRILTAVLIGAGSSLIHDIFEPSPDVIIETPTVVATVATVESNE